MEGGQPVSGSVRVEQDDVYAIGLMAEYLAGPGFTGWLAYLDQEVKQVATECPSCGGSHELPPVDADVVRANLGRYMS
jgi:hypothetical protein